MERFDELFSKLPEHVRNPDPSRYLGDNFLVVDFETTNTEKGNPNNPANSLVLAVWYYKGKYHTKFGTEYEQHELIRDCQEADFVVAHNTKFEIGWLRRCGLDIYNTLFYCTQIGEYVLAGNRGLSLSLKASSARRGLGCKSGLVSSLLELGICPGTVDTGILGTYGIQDVRLALKLFLMQRKELNEKSLLPVAYTRNLFTPCLVDIESKGLQLDKDRVQSVYRTITAQLAEKKTELDVITGGANTKSGKQMRKVIFEDLKFSLPEDYRGDYYLTPKGKGLQKEGLLDNPVEYAQTGWDAVAALKCRNKKQKRFQELYLEVNSLRDMLSKYLNKFKLCCEESGGILYAVFNQTFVATHRLCSNGRFYKTQLQNIDNALKPLFGSRSPENKVVEVDYRQLEFRVAAYLYGDVQASEDIALDYDVHTWSAS